MNFEHETKEAGQTVGRRDFLRVVSASALAAAIPGTIGNSLASGNLVGNVEVNASVLQHRIDPRIYGHFIEHIGRVIQQGLWAELLRNRKFYPVDPENTQVADPWIAESDRSDISYVIDRTTSLSGVSSQRVTLFGKSGEWRGIGQAGFDVLGGREYVAYACSLRTDERSFYT
jgi:hypothetical protein